MIGPAKRRIVRKAAKIDDRRMLEDAPIVYRPHRTIVYVRTLDANATQRMQTLAEITNTNQAQHSIPGHHSLSESNRHTLATQSVEAFLDHKSHH